MKRKARGPALPARAKVGQHSQQGLALGVPRAASGAWLSGAVVSRSSLLDAKVDFCKVQWQAHIRQWPR